MSIVIVVQSLSCVGLFVTLWTVAHQAPLSIGFSRQKYWSELPCPSPGDLPDPGITPGSPELQVDSLPAELPGKPYEQDSAVLCLVAQPCSTFSDPVDCSLPGSSVHGDSLGNNTGEGCHALLQGIFPTQRSNQVSCIASKF